METYNSLFDSSGADLMIIPSSFAATPDLGTTPEPAAATLALGSAAAVARTADGAAGNVPLSRGDEEPLLVSDGDMWSQTNNALKWLHIPKVPPNARRFPVLAKHRLLLAI